MKLKRTHKNLMLDEASFLYCKRHNINLTLDEFFDQIFMTEDFDKEGEWDKIAKDLSFYKQSTVYEYELKEITEEEYDLCVKKFGGV